MKKCQRCGIKLFGFGTWLKYRVVCNAVIDQQRVKTPEDEAITIALRQRLKQFFGEDVLSDPMEGT